MMASLLTFLGVTVFLGVAYTLGYLTGHKQGMTQAYIEMKEKP